MVKNVVNIAKISGLLRLAYCAIVQKIFKTEIPEQKCVDKPKFVYYN